MLLPNKPYSQQSLRCSPEVKNRAKNALTDTSSLSFRGHSTKQLLNQHFLPLMPQLLLPTSDPASFPPSACNIHLGERCHDETHILMLTRTLPWALFTTSVTYHQINLLLRGESKKRSHIYISPHWRLQNNSCCGQTMRVYALCTDEPVWTLGSLGPLFGHRCFCLRAHVCEGGRVQGDFHRGLLISSLH